MGITAIKSIANRHENSVYYVRDLENPNATGGTGKVLQVDVGQTVQCNMWIPWCWSETQFINDHRRILIAPPAFNEIPVRFNIWQQGDYVRYSTDGLFHSDGTLVPGNATINGDRSVEITGTTIFDADLRFF